VTATTASEFHLVDSSGWVEYIGDGPKADAFAPYLEKEDALLVPTIVIYEVCKKLAKTEEKIALDRFLSRSYRATEVPLDSYLAIAAARVSLELRLGMANAMILATAQAFDAQLITLDADFRGLPGVLLI